MTIKLAIADENAAYVERLKKVLEEYEDISLYAYTEKKELEQALASKHFDVLLFDPSIYDGRPLGKSTLAVMLAGDAAEIPEYCRELQGIHKYQRISRIYQQVLELCAEICRDAGNVVGQGSVTSIAFYSPAGGVGKTTLALAAAARLAAQGGRTLYLNLEEAASEDCCLPQTADKGMSEIVSCLGQKVNFAMKVQGLLQNKTENLYYFNHFGSPNDIYEMSGEELKELLEQLAKTRLFDFIVIDMGISMDRKFLHVFEYADKIVLVEKADDMAVRKLNCFLAQVHIMKEYGRKMARVLNFDMGRGSMLSTEVPLIGRINAAQSPDAAQFVAMLAQDAGSGYLTQLLSI